MVGMNATTQTDMTAANAILEQLGGRRFLVMTGAKDLMGGADSLQFKLPARFAKDGINAVRVVLAADDTYSVSLFRVGRAPTFAVTTVKQLDLVYGEDLRRIFTEATGLDTSLGRAI